MENVEEKVEINQIEPERVEKVEIDQIEPEKVEKIEVKNKEKSSFLSFE
jgi:hypothetical protein